MQGHEDFLNHEDSKTQSFTKKKWRNKKPRHFCRGCIKNQLMIILLMQPVA